MKLDLGKFTGASNNIETLTKDLSGHQYIMLNIEDSNIKLCYSDGKISYIETVEGEREPSDEATKIVVELSNLLQKLGLYKESAEVKVEPLSLTLGGEDSILMHCKKYINQIEYDEDGEMIDNGEGEALTKRIDCSDIHTQLKYEKVSDSLKFSMTTRMNYDEIFSGDSWVTCSVNEFKSLLNKLSKTDGARDCYLSPKAKSAFSVGTAYTVVLPVDFDIVAAALNITAVKKLFNVLSKVKDDTINLKAQDSQFLKIATETEDMGIVFEQSPAVRQQIATMETFSKMDYSGQGVLFNKSVLSDMVSGAVAVSGKEQETELAFTVKDDVVVASTVKKGTGNGIDDFNVYAYDVVGEILQFMDFKVSMSFVVLKNILSNCDGNMIDFSFAHTEDSIYLRITDVLRQGKERKALGYYYMCV